MGIYLFLLYSLVILAQTVLGTSEKADKPVEYISRLVYRVSKSNLRTTHQDDLIKGESTSLELQGFYQDTTHRIPVISDAIEEFLKRFAPMLPSPKSYYRIKYEPLQLGQTIIEYRPYSLVPLKDHPISIIREDNFDFHLWEILETNNGVVLFDFMASSPGIAKRVLDSHEKKLSSLLPEVIVQAAQNKKDGLLNRILSDPVLFNRLPRELPGFSFLLPRDVMLNTFADVLLGDFEILKIIESQITLDMWPDLIDQFFNSKAGYLFMDLVDKNVVLARRIISQYPERIIRTFTHNPERSQVFIDTLLRQDISSLFSRDHWGILMSTYIRIESTEAIKQIATDNEVMKLFDDQDLLAFAEKIQPLREGASILNRGAFLKRLPGHFWLKLPIEKSSKEQLGSQTLKLLMDENIITKLTEDELSFFVFHHALGNVQFLPTFAQVLVSSSHIRTRLSKNQLQYLYRYLHAKRLNIPMLRLLGYKDVLEKVDTRFLESTVLDWLGSKIGPSILDYFDKEQFYSKLHPTVWKAMITRSFESPSQQHNVWKLLSKENLMQYIDSDDPTWVLTLLNKHKINDRSYVDILVRKKLHPDVWFAFLKDFIQNGQHQLVSVILKDTEIMAQMSVPHQLVLTQMILQRPQIVLPQAPDLYASSVKRLALLSGPAVVGQGVYKSFSRPERSRKPNIQSSMMRRPSAFQRGMVNQRRVSHRPMYHLTHHIL